MNKLVFGAVLVCFRLRLRINLKKAEGSWSHTTIEKHSSETKFRHICKQTHTQKRSHHRISTAYNLRNRGNASANAFNRRKKTRFFERSTIFMRYNYVDHCPRNPHDGMAQMLNCLSKRIKCPRVADRWKCSDSFNTSLHISNDSMQSFVLIERDLLQKFRPQILSFTIQMDGAHT